MKQPYAYIYPHIPSLLSLPPTLPIPPLSVVAKHGADLPVLCCCFPLVIYFTFGGIHMSMLLSFHPSFPLPPIIQKESCTTMFIAALFTIARTWKQPKCPSTDEWIKKMWHIYTMEYYSAIKRNEIQLFVVRWMDLESVTQSEVSQKEKNKYRMLTHIYGI